MRTFIIAALVAMAAAGAPVGKHGGGGYGHVDYYEPRPYHYEYAVNDPHYGPMMAQSEKSNGDGAVEGWYSVNLPDGRTQHVKYIADHYAGYNAEVSYDGYANHPERRGYGHSGPRYAAVPVVKTAVKYRPH